MEDNLSNSSGDVIRSSSTHQREQQQQQQRQEHPRESSPTSGPPSIRSTDAEGEDDDEDNVSMEPGSDHGLPFELQPSAEEGDGTRSQDQEEVQNQATEGRKCCSTGLVHPFVNEGVSEEETARTAALSVDQLKKKVWGHQYGLNFTVYQEPAVEGEYTKFGNRDLLPAIISFGFGIVVFIFIALFSNFSDTVGATFLAVAVTQMGLGLVGFGLHYIPSEEQRTLRSLGRARYWLNNIISVWAVWTIALMIPGWVWKCRVVWGRSSPACTNTFEGTTVIAILAFPVLTRIRSLTVLLVLVPAPVFAAISYFYMWKHPDGDLLRVIAVSVWCYACLYAGTLTLVRNKLLERQFEQHIEAEQATHAMEAERTGTDTLLAAMLPRSITLRLVAGETINDVAPHATVFMSDIASFTKWSAEHTAHQVTALINWLTVRFDIAALENSVEKVKTIGDAYWAACGLPTHCEYHASNIVLFALKCQDIVQAASQIKEWRVRTGATAGSDWSEIQTRVGIHSGELLGGVLNASQLSYEIFGQTNDIAQSCERYGVAGEVCVSNHTKLYLEAEGKMRRRHIDWIERKKRAAEEAEEAKKNPLRMKDTNNGEECRDETSPPEQPEEDPGLVPLPRWTFTPHSSFIPGQEDGSHDVIGGEQDLATEESQEIFTYFVRAEPSPSQQMSLLSPLLSPGPPQPGNADLGFDDDGEFGSFRVPMEPQQLSPQAAEIDLRTAAHGYLRKRISLIRKMQKTKSKKDQPRKQSNKGILSNKTSPSKSHGTPRTPQALQFGIAGSSGEHSASDWEGSQAADEQQQSSNRKGKNVVISSDLPQHEKSNSVSTNDEGWKRGGMPGRLRNDCSDGSDALDSAQSSATLASRRGVMNLSELTTEASLQVDAQQRVQGEQQEGGQHRDFESEFSVQDFVAFISKTTFSFGSIIYANADVEAQYKRFNIHRLHILRISCSAIVVTLPLFICGMIVLQTSGPSASRSYSTDELGKTMTPDELEASRKFGLFLLLLVTAVSVSLATCSLMLQSWVQTIYKAEDETPDHVITKSNLSRRASMAPRQLWEDRPSTANSSFRVASGAEDVVETESALSLTPSTQAPSLQQQGDQEDTPSPLGPKASWLLRNQHKVDAVLLVVSEVLTVSLFLIDQLFYHPLEGSYMSNNPSGWNLVFFMPLGFSITTWMTPTQAMAMLALAFEIPLMMVVVIGLPSSVWASAAFGGISFLVAACPVAIVHDRTQRQEFLEYQVAMYAQWHKEHEARRYEFLLGAVMPSVVAVRLRAWLSQKPVLIGTHQDAAEGPGRRRSSVAAFPVPPAPSRSRPSGWGDPSDEEGSKPEEQEADVAAPLQQEYKCLVVAFIKFDPRASRVAEEVGKRVARNLSSSQCQTLHLHANSTPGVESHGGRDSNLPQTPQTSSRGSRGSARPISLGGVAILESPEEQELPPPLADAGMGSGGVNLGSVNLGGGFGTTSEPVSPGSTLSRPQTVKHRELEAAVNWDYMTTLSTCLDEVLLNRGDAVCKIKTIGNTVLLAGPIHMDDTQCNVVGGQNTRKKSDRPTAKQTAREMLTIIERLKAIPELGDVRVGLHAGPAVGVVLGADRVAFDILGATVNRASRTLSAKDGGPTDVLATREFVTLLHRPDAAGQAQHIGLQPPTPRHMFPVPKQSAAVMEANEGNTSLVEQVPARRTLTAMGSSDAAHTQPPLQQQHSLDAVATDFREAMTTHMKGIGDVTLYRQLA